MQKKWRGWPETFAWVAEIVDLGSLRQAIRTSGSPHGAHRCWRSGRSQPRLWRLRAPLVLEHNTPNNSVALLWAETAGGDTALAMRPLFRQRRRHE